VGLFKRTYCYCGSGREAGFCSHRPATRQTATVRNGRKVETPKPKGGRK
jgi:hypothetical protein